MNGKIGIARSIHSDRGRVGVEILGKNGCELDSYGAAVGIKNSNLEVVRDEDGYKLLDRVSQQEGAQRREYEGAARSVSREIRHPRIHCYLAE